MRKGLMTAIALLFLFVFVAPVKNVSAEVKMGISLGSEGLNNFYMALSDYNRLPEANIVAIRNSGIPDEHVPVVLFIAARAQVAPDVIAKMRLKGMSWMKIAAKFNLGPDTFYVPANDSYAGTVYEKPYNGFKKDRKQWKRIKLSDDDVVNMVNLKFASEYHNYTPEQVVKLRSSGRSFIDIHNDINTERVQKAKHDKKWYEINKKVEVKHGYDSVESGNRGDDQGGNNDDHHHGR
jgi:hypothetical protein